MRVALFTDTFLPEVNGVAKTLGRWSAYLESRGVPCRVFAPTANPQGVSESSLSVERFYSIPFFLYPECKFTIPNPLYIKQSLREFNPTLIHVATPFNLGLIGNHYARKRGIPLVASYHTHFDQYLAYYRMSWMEPMVWKYMEWFHASCRKVYVPSRSTLEHLQQREFPELEVWGRGVDSALFTSGADRAQILRHHGVDSSRFIVLYVGRLAPEKSVDVLIRAFRAVPAEIQQRMELLIVGDGPLYDELSTMTVNDKNIHLLGFRHGPHLHELYAAADVFFFPSATETFGNVVLESFASGTPVIGADAGGVKELVRQGQTGWLCPPGDIPAFSQALVESVDNVALLAQMSAASKAYATLHSWDHIFDRLLTSYQAVQSESVTSMQSVAL